MLPTATENVPVEPLPFATFVVPRSTAQPVGPEPLTETEYVALVPLFAVWVAVTLTAVLLPWHDEQALVRLGNALADMAPAATSAAIAETSKGIR